MLFKKSKLIDGVNTIFLKYGHITNLVLIIVNTTHGIVSGIGNNTYHTNQKVWLSSDSPRKYRICKRHRHETPSIVLGMYLYGALQRSPCVEEMKRRRDMKLVIADFTYFNWNCGSITEIARTRHIIGDIARAWLIIRDFKWI